MKTQNTNLVFTKKSIAELTDSESININGGGSTYVCSNCIPDPIGDKIREALTL